jgi:hypothetical protein
MAYLVSYDEWRLHYPAKKEPRKIALETAVFTFIPKILQFTTRKLSFLFRKSDFPINILFGYILV